MDKCINVNISYQSHRYWSKLKKKKKKDTAVKRNYFHKGRSEVSNTVFTRRNVREKKHLNTSASYVLSPICVRIKTFK